MLQYNEPVGTHFVPGCFRWAGTGREGGGAKGGARARGGPLPQRRRARGGRSLSAGAGRRRNVGGVRAGAAARQGGGEPGDAAAAAGGERPADPLHRGVPEQGPRHRLRAVPAYPAQKPHLFGHDCGCDATQRAEDRRVTARTGRGASESREASV